MSDKTKFPIINGVKNTIVALEVLRIPQRIQELEDRPMGVRGGGGSSSGSATANIQVLDESVSLTTSLSSLNFAGAGVTATNVGNAVTVTIPGGSAGSGITRNIANISTNTTAGATADTDYVYFVTLSPTLTLPTAVGNKNRYSVTNFGTGSVTVAADGSETINGSASIVIGPSESRDFISNNTNWGIF